MTVKAIKAMKGYDHPPSALENSVMISLRYFRVRLVDGHTLSLPLLL